MSSHGDDIVQLSDSDDGTSSSGTLFMEASTTQKIIDDLQSMMEGLDELKVTAVAWDLQIPDHQYSRKVKEDISNLVLEITVLYSSIETLQHRAINGLHVEHPSDYRQQVDDLHEQWASLNEVVQSFELRPTEPEQHEEHFDSECQVDTAGVSKRRRM